MAVHPTASVHPTAIIADGAEIAAGVQIGPYCVIGAEVSIGEDSELKAHIVIDGWTSMGARNTVFPFASLGQRPQDLKFKGERTRLEIGDGNAIREYVTMNPGTEGGGGVTRVGNGCLFMNHVHIGHDCLIGNDVIFANAATLGGHITVGDKAVLGGISAVHQFCRIGHGAMIGGMTGVAADVIPYGLVMGERGSLAGLNLVGLKRRGVEREHISGLRSGFQALFAGGGTLTERIGAVTDSHSDNPLMQEVIEFLQVDSSRHFVTPKTDDGGSGD